MICLMWRWLSIIKIIKQRPVDFISCRALYCFLVTFLGCQAPESRAGCPIDLALSPESLREHLVREIGPHHLTPIASYNEVRAALQSDPYDYANLPTIPIVNFSLDAWRAGADVFTRSIQILIERHVLLEVPRPKPIHPMGLGIAGTLEFYPGQTDYSGVFRGGSFPVLGRFSISQGNPGRTELRREHLGVVGPIQEIPQVRSTTMGLLVFDPKLEAHQISPIVSLVLQDDLNGKLASDGESPFVLEQTILNKPEFDPSKLTDRELARLYHFGTLAGVFVGARSSFLERVGEDPNGVEETRFGVNALLRPPHGFANFGETDPDQIKSPVWMKFVPRGLNLHRRLDDFRKEVFETIRDGGPVIYDVFAGHEFVRATGEIRYQHVGEFRMEEAFAPSKGADQRVIIPHADVSPLNFFTNQTVYDSIQVID